MAVQNQEKKENGGKIDEELQIAAMSHRHKFLPQNTPHYVFKYYTSCVSSTNQLSGHF